ncbi:hypothetical protein B0I35DRAFT_475170 [Stachybotrys elegans]|uniref:Lipocalin-like domain-containing protein n=1 Tax=Stachybotrys elegans TaxID=80388 RepID=A0A8K0T143_9HYPO|nr:hypothetical protein B0I35DRAFT_475170 [Stachybotrys elegans]
MAAPASKTIQDLSGKWVMSKALSDSSDSGLSLQGINFVLRKTIGLATVNIDVKQHIAPPSAPNKSTDPVTHVDLLMSAAGLSSSQENRCLDDTWRESSDWLFGTVRARVRFTSIEELDDAFLKKGWLKEGEGKTLIIDETQNVKSGWTATQVWGFQIVKGERRYCRNLLVKKGSKRAEIRLVYDYQG